MDRALSAAASGMEAQELRMGVIANNLSNVNTNGFKRSRIEFQDILYENLRPVTAPALDNNQVPAGLQIGQGVRTAGTLREFSEGAIRQTGRQLDVAIEGEGFLQVLQPNGQIGYTRDGALKTDARGRIVNTDGLPLEPNIVIPNGYMNQVSISADGIVSALPPGQTTPVNLGQLTLATFTNAAGLEPLGHNLYRATIASGDPLIYQPGQYGTGTLAQGFIEGSNVRAMDEMIDLITTQRAYEMGTRVIQAADQMLGSTSNLR